MKKNKFYIINVWFLVIAIFVTIGLLSAIVYSLQFLSFNLIHAFSSETGSEKTYNFDIEKAQQIGL